MLFKDYLVTIGINPEVYFNIASMFALNNGYDPSLLKFSNKQKLEYNGIHFGAKYDTVTGKFNNDYIIYLLKHDENAHKYRDNYLRRTDNISGNWRNDLQSKNSLSRNILWFA